MKEFAQDIKAAGGLVQYCSSPRDKKKYETPHALFAMRLINTPYIELRYIFGQNAQSASQELKSEYMNAERNCTECINTILIMARSNREFLQAKRGGAFSFFAQLPITDIVHILNKMCVYSTGFKFNKVKMTIHMLEKYGIDLNCNADEAEYCKPHEYINKSMLGYSIQQGYKDLASELISCGANIDYKIGCEKISYLMIFASNGLIDAVKMLMEFNANPFLKNAHGNTALSKITYSHTSCKDCNKVLEMIDILTVYQTRYMAKQDGYYHAANKSTMLEM